MALPMNSVQFKSIVEPILSEPFDGVFELRKDEQSRIFQLKKGIKRRYHEIPVLYGMQSAPEMPEGTPVIYGQGGVLYIGRFTFKVFGMAFALTQVLSEDDEVLDVGRVFSESAANALIDTKETRCANVFNRGFNGSYVWADGQPLFSASHPGAYGVTLSNLLSAAAFSQTSVEQAAIQIRKAVNFQGQKSELSPTQLILPPELWLQGEVILKSVLRSSTANNDINPVVSAGLFSKGRTILSRLTSGTAWFVQTSAQENFKLLWRRKPTRTMEGDFETDSMRFKVTERYIEAIADMAHAAWGNAGA